MRLCVIFVETPKSRTQVSMDAYGAMEMHNKVVLEANSAGVHGGAVSLPSNLFHYLPVVVYGDKSRKV